MRSCFEMMPSMGIVGVHPFIPSYHDNAERRKFVTDKYIIYIHLDNSMTKDQGKKKAYGVKIEREKAGSRESGLNIRHYKLDDGANLY